MSQPTGLVFTEEAAARGVVHLAPPGTAGVWTFGSGIAFADLDQDDDPDLIAVGRAGGEIGVFRNAGDGTFVDVGPLTGIAPMLRANGIAAADFDADGDIDLFLCGFCAPSRLLRNDGDFRFVDVTAEAGMDAYGAATGASWGDVDNDGWLDLYVGVAHGAWCGSGFFQGGNRLYINRRDGTFDEVGVQRGVHDPGTFTFQGVIVDFDRDGDADIITAEDAIAGACDVHHTKVYSNRGDGTFDEVSGEIGADVCLHSMTATLGDVNADGRMDVYFTNRSGPYALIVSGPGGNYTDRAGEAGVGVGLTGWGAVMLDCDHDGRLDLYVCNETGPNNMFIAGDGPAMTDHAGALGCADAGRSFGVARADIDNDGDLDLAVANEGSPVRLFVNGSTTPGWLKVRVLGDATNTGAIGAYVEVRTGELRQTRVVLAGSGYKSQDELAKHFGLGGVAHADELRVVWPDGLVRVFGHVPADRTVVVTRRLAEITLDGVVDDADFFEFVGRFFGPPGQAIDINTDGFRNEQDFFDFVNDFFAH